MPSSGTVAIYVLIDPRDMTVRYVGRSMNPKARLYFHVSKVGVGRPSSRSITLWTGELRGLGLRPSLVMIECCTRRSYPAAERGWIAYYRRRGHLYNRKDGDRWSIDNGPSLYKFGKPMRHRLVIEAAATDAAEKPRRRRA